jgi:hypothetical protein
MTPSAVQNQVEIIVKATELALRSKEAAMKFLLDAKIVTQEKPQPTHPVKSN